MDPLIDNVEYNIDNQKNKASFTQKDENIVCIYDFENTYEGKVKFTKIDRTSYIISGTFEFSTNKNDCKDIKITNSRFDLKYIP